MCLAVPGKIESIFGDDPLQKTGKVNFSGISRDVNLAYVPESKVGDYVIVHVGFALSIVDEDEANKLIEKIRMLDDVGKEEMGPLDEIH